MNSSARIIWFFGLPGAGKSTLATALAARWREQGRIVKVLDGDELRRGLCVDLGFSEVDRRENIRRAAETAKLFADEGICVIAAFITPTEELRQLARDIIGLDRLDLVFVKCPVATCKARDPKGHYGEAERGGRPLFTGIGSAFEEPQGKGGLCIDTSMRTAPECIQWIEASLAPGI